MQCYGPEATKFTKSLLPSDVPLHLERDVVARDDYGRMLAYVYLAGDGEFVNLTIIRNGFARPLTIAPNSAHADEFVAGRTPAEADNIGLWGGCTGIASAADGCTRRTSRLRRLTPSWSIISCDDLGACHAANVGVYGALRDGVATCASIMVPAPWARDAALRYRPDRRHRRAPDAQLRVRGVPVRAHHARPVAAQRRGRLPAPHRRPVGARRPRGGAPRMPRPDRAGAGLGHRRDPSHAAPHGHHAAARVLRRVPRARRRVPPAHPPAIDDHADQAGFPFRQLAADEGVVFPDHFNHDWRAGSRERVYDEIRNLQPGVTEIHVQPAIDTPEVRALTDAAPGWIDDYELVTDDTKLEQLLADSGATLIGYRLLRDAMRAG